MADNTLSSNGTDSVDEALHRLSRKPGVKGWLMLDRLNGAILKTSGQISSIRPAKSSNTETTLPTPTGGSFSGDVANPADTDNDTETKAAQELGSMIWAFLSTAGSLVQEIDTEVHSHGIWNPWETNTNVCGYRMSSSYCDYERRSRNSLLSPRPSTYWSSYMTRHRHEQHCTRKAY